MITCGVELIGKVPALALIISLGARHPVLLYGVPFMHYKTLNKSAKQH